MGAFFFLLASIAATAPVAQDCQSAIGPLYDGPEESALPGQVDGASLAGAPALIALRRERGEALIVVRGGDFSGADLRSARLHNICFFDTTFARSQWQGAQAPGLGFIRADLSGADFSEAHMPRVHFRNAQLNGADASRANLSGGRLDGGWWTGNVENLRLEEADLSGFRFDCGITLDDGCPINGEVDARGANLSGASIHGFSLIRNLAGARIDRTEIGLDQLEDVDGAELAGPIVLRGGEAVAELAPAEYRALRPRLRRPGEAPRPSFDCGRADSPAERAICGPDGAALRSLDLSVDRLYRRALASDPSVERSQAAWLRERDNCLVEPNADSWCMVSIYERRREALAALLGPPEWVRPGTVAAFIGPVVEFDPEFYGEPLYARLVPVLIGASWSRAVVRTNADGTIDVRGDAVGANAHLCSLTGDRLFHDRSNGWYSGPYSPSADDPVEYRGRPMPVLMFWDDRAQVYQHGRPFSGEGGDPRFSDYASCGMRASFGELMRVSMPQDEALRLFESFGSAP